MLLEPLNKSDFPLVVEWVVVRINKVYYKGDRP